MKVTIAILLTSPSLIDLRIFIDFMFYIPTSLSFGIHSHGLFTLGTPRRLALQGIGINPQFTQFCGESIGLSFGLGLSFLGFLGFQLGGQFFSLGNDHSLCTCQQHIILQIPPAHPR